MSLRIAALKAGFSIVIMAMCRTAAEAGVTIHGVSAARTQRNMVKQLLPLGRALLRILPTRTRCTRPTIPRACYTWQVFMANAEIF